MKKNTILLAVLGLTLLAGCDTKTSSSTSAPTTESTPTITETDTNSGTGEESSELPEWVDYASQVHLQLDYEGKDFFVDGVGEMKTAYPIDGDTVHFDPVVTTTSRERIKCRFYGIDTPESTGDVQEWGVPASNYTKQIINEAIENGTVVLTCDTYSEYKKPVHDSTGERYLTCVYVNTEKKHAPKEELQLLNLMIVQEGYSWARNTANIPELADYFLNAQIQATNYKLHIFSDEKDPTFNYSKEYVQTSLLDLYNEQKKGIASQLAGGMAFDGTQSMNIVGSANGAVGKITTQVGDSDFKAYLRDEIGNRIDASSYTDLIPTDEEEETTYYLVGYDDMAAMRQVYLTDKAENGVILTTTDIEQAARFVVEGGDNGLCLKTGDYYLGYDIFNTTEPGLSYSDKNWTWRLAEATQELSIVLKNFYDNRRVSVQGTVVGFSNHILYLQDNYLNEDTGEISSASINVFVGMNAISDRYKVNGTYLEVRGLAKDSQFGFQITDTNFPYPSFGDEDESRILFPAGSEELDDIHKIEPTRIDPQTLSTYAENNSLDYLNFYVEVTEPVTCSGGYVDGTEACLYLEGLDFDIYLAFTYKGNPDNENEVWSNIEYFKGHSFMVNGVFTVHKSTAGNFSFQINPSGMDSLVVVA